MRCQAGLSPAPAGGWIASTARLASLEFLVDLVDLVLDLLPLVAEVILVVGERLRHREAADRDGADHQRSARWKRDGCG